MKPNTIRFPGAYHTLVRTLRVDFQPSHFFDLVVLGFVGLAFFTSVLRLGGVSQSDSVAAPRLVAAAFLLHVFSQVIRSAHGVRVRWTGFLFAPFALWLLIDGVFLSPCAWRGREQASVALTAALAFWIVSHHLRHRVHRWCMIGGMALVATIFGALVIAGGYTILPRLAQRAEAKIYTQLEQQSGPFATPGEFGAFLLLTLLPTAAVLCSPALRQRRRVAAGLATVLGACGLWTTHHAPAWYGLVAGTALLCLLLIERKRLACLFAAAAFGLLFFIPKFTAGTPSGLLRKDDGRAPLADAALKIFTENPVKGAGSGAFPAAFESTRPAGWDLDPLTAGGFFHQLAAENGLAGLLLLVPPALLLWALLFRKTWLTPVRLVRYDPQFRKKNLYTPDDRIAGAGVLAGSLAAGVSLAFDYAAPSVSLALAFAVTAAIAARAVCGDFATMTVKPSPSPSFTLRMLPGLAVFAAFAATVFPAFESAAYARRASEILEASRENPLSTENENPEQARMGMLKRRLRESALTDAEANARRALRLAPDNARAGATLSGTLAERIRTSGKKDGAAECLDAALGAAAHSGGEVATSLPLVTALRLHGRDDEAFAHLAKLRAAAPENAPLAVEEIRTLLARGDTSRALPLLKELLRKEPWNKEARRLLKIAGINPDVSVK